MPNYNFYVYILTNASNKVMYIGVTNNLERRLYEHKHGIFEGFTKKYHVDKLVYYEHFQHPRRHCPGKAVKRLDADKKERAGGDGKSRVGRNSFGRMKRFK